MARKTYVPTLVRILHMVCAYITRYKVAIIAGLTALEVVQAQQKVEAVLLACQALTDAVDIPVNP